MNCQVVMRKETHCFPFLLQVFFPPEWLVIHFLSEPAVSASYIGARNFIPVFSYVCAQNLLHKCSTGLNAKVTFLKTLTVHVLNYSNLNPALALHTWAVSTETNIKITRE